MSSETASITEIGELSAPDSTESWVREVLEPEQLTASKMHYGRRELSTGTIVMLWALRFYVVLMVCIIALEIRNALHG